MRKSNRVLLTALAAVSLLVTGAQVTATAGPTGASDAGEPINTHWDRSGRVQITVYARTSHGQQVYRDHTVTLPDPDMVVVGGGAHAPIHGWGAMLTASYPTEDRRGWRASSKDHLKVQPHSLTTYVIGMKIAGMSAAQLREHVAVTSNPSDSAHQAETQVGPPRTGGPWVMLGGGFRVDWHGAGNLATASFPVSEVGWKVRSKDHVTADKASVTGYGMYIKQHLPVGTVGGIRVPRHGGPAGHPQAGADVGADYALTGGGAEVDYGSGWGNMLWRLQPSAAPDRSFHAGSKDHIHDSPAKITAWALGVQLF
ncbi:hypothetical protein M8C13_20225 [Crossiella sp. SN42]|uniref:hypothetical protein n=1 Tax=Crossiella sp. SN42 TaxID=2944808 RepID=UPI00207D5A1B|nr:hypothetical protein [Crossiella sp. SN42]MCO1578083.1 hypothetical protein [Crossiella sp. SN42]